MVCVKTVISNLQLCRGGSVTALVKRLVREGLFLSEDLIAFIIHETLKVYKYNASCMAAVFCKEPKVLLTP